MLDIHVRCDIVGCSNRFELEVKNQSTYKLPEGWLTLSLGSGMFVRPDAKDDDFFICREHAKMFPLEKK